MAQVVGKSYDDRVTCRRCGAIIQFELGDVVPGEKLGDGDYAKVVICPNTPSGTIVRCGNKIPIVGLGVFDALDMQERENRQWREDARDI